MVSLVSEETDACGSSGESFHVHVKRYEVIACNSLEWKFSQMEAVEDFESRPHKAV